VIFTLVARAYESECPLTLRFPGGFMLAASALNLWMAPIPRDQMGGRQRPIWPFHARGNSLRPQFLEKAGICLG
jgi:hypothetical protein